MGEHMDTNTQTTQDTESLIQDALQEGDELTDDQVFELIYDWDLAERVFANKHEAFIRGYDAASSNALTRSMPPELKEEA